ncbi:hypothetical protein CI109_106479 [Kwoniella shandongensis]|uniref:Uncharacterized protein n=1 Tax=Kwoniella shandongensis TaxID=1734106 RepID=A0A5M6C1L5_9TREE|nr:uncharacterized protein CI109_002661 [Kwoniella shandongensis]KAA5528904.1 hypothetical protein CI109_002661 [Kwoniella shandongensis]
MSEAPQTEAQKRAAARKAKILARGNSGLAKLAQTARGDEAQALYGDDAKPSSTSTPTTETPSAASQPSWAPPPPSSSSSTRPAAAAPQGISPEQQAMSAQLEAMMSMFGGAPGAPGAGGEGLPDMSRLLAQMMGGDPSSFGGAPGGGASNLLGDVDDPAGLGGIPPNLFGPPGAGGGDMPAFPSFPGMPGFGGAASKPRSKAEKYFPLVHFISIILLSIFAVAWWEPALFKVSPTSLLSTWPRRWAGLSGRRDSAWRLKGFGEVEILPLFWAFTTLELILQTTRFTIFKSPPPPHSLLATFLPLLPPAISRPLLTGSRYLNLLSQTNKDGCLLVFGVGMTVVLAEWLRG